MMHESPEYFRGLFTVQKIVDTLRYFYWLTLSPKVSATQLPMYHGTQPIYHPVGFLGFGVWDFGDLGVFFGGFGFPGFRVYVTRNRNGHICYFFLGFGFFRFGFIIYFINFLFLL